MTTESFIEIFCDFAEAVLEEKGIICPDLLRRCELDADYTVASISLPSIPANSLGNLDVRIEANYPEEYSPIDARVCWEYSIQGGEIQPFTDYVIFTECDRKKIDFYIPKDDYRKVANHVLLGMPASRMMYEDLQEYEEITGFTCNEAFVIGWQMARMRMSGSNNNMEEDI